MAVCFSGYLAQTSKIHILLRKLKLGCVSVQIVATGSDVEDAHFTWKVEFWLSISVEIVRIGSNIEDAHFMCAFLI